MDQPIACTLAPDELRNRTEDLAAIATRSLRERAPIPGGERLTFAGDEATEHELRAVVMSVPEKLLGAGALVMALCCAVLPLAGAALGGGLIAGEGTLGVVVGVVVLVAVISAVTRRRRVGSRC